MNNVNCLIENLNHYDVNIRLESLVKLMKMTEKGEISASPKTDIINNHIHTFYSFSPYSPTKAIWMAHLSGLPTAGIMDHDSIAGAWEFIKAGEIAKIATTIGVECRADFSSTPLNGKKINNPDQETIAYVALHGIPHTQIEKVKEYFSKYLKRRIERNKKMVENINNLLKDFDIYLDFEKDVVSISKFNEGGSITERHILFSLGQKLVEKYGMGEDLTQFLENKLKIELKPKIKDLLLDENNQFYYYDLLGALKSDFVPRFYINAKEECPDIKEVVEFSNEIGAIIAYAYLGDVKESVTGDKRSEKFEDEYIELLFEVLKDLGFRAVTYMPSRNSMEQLKRVRDLCERYGFMQISGEDINSPRQSFICQALKNQEFKNLIDSTWALIGHELMATKDLKLGMFSDETIKRYPDLNGRIKVFKEYAFV